jgi:sugar lactone lactonase YvrE
MKSPPSSRLSQVLNVSGDQPRNSISAELYVRHDSNLGEGPVWDDGTLFWVDITGKSILAKRDGVETVERFPVGIEVGAIVPWDGQRFVLAGPQGFQVYDLVTRTLKSWANPETSLPHNRFNDGKCDPRGRFVAGTLHRGGDEKQSALYVLDHDRSVREIYRPVTCSNGLAWSETGTTFYYIDTATGVVRSFAYDLETARLTDERTVIEIPKAHGLPDGMCIDRAGNLWIALWGGWGVECWSPVSGQRLSRIEVPAAQATSCAFGGPKYDTLFITTARYGLDEAALAAQPLAGSVFCTRPGVMGYKAVHFKSHAG